MSHKAEYYFMRKGKLSNNREHSLSHVKQDEYTYSTFYGLFYKRTKSSWVKIGIEEIPTEFKAILLLEGLI